MRELIQNQLGIILVEKGKNQIQVYNRLRLKNDDQILIITKEQLLGYLIQEQQSSKTFYMQIDQDLKINCVRKILQQQCQQDKDSFKYQEKQQNNQLKYIIWSNNGQTLENIIQVLNYLQQLEFIIQKQFKLYRAQQILKKIPNDNQCVKIQFQIDISANIFKIKKIISYLNEQLEQAAKLVELIQCDNENQRKILKYKDALPKQFEILFKNKKRLRNCIPQIEYIVKQLQDCFTIVDHETICVEGSRQYIIRIEEKLNSLDGFLTISKFNLQLRQEILHIKCQSGQKIIDKIAKQSHVLYTFEDDGTLTLVSITQNENSLINFQRKYGRYCEQIDNVSLLELKLKFRPRLLEQPNINFPSINQSLYKQECNVVIKLLKQGQQLKVSIYGLTFYSVIKALTQVQQMLRQFNSSIQYPKKIDEIWCPFISQYSVLHRNTFRGCQILTSQQDELVNKNFMYILFQQQDNRQFNILEAYEQLFQEIKSCNRFRFIIKNLDSSDNMAQLDFLNKINRFYRIIWGSNQRANQCFHLYWSATDGNLHSGQQIRNFKNSFNIIMQAQISSEKVRPFIQAISQQNKNIDDIQKQMQKLFHVKIRIQNEQKKLKFYYVDIEPEQIKNENLINLRQKVDQFKKKIQKQILEYIENMVESLEYKKQFPKLQQFIRI